jgi:hypothetical protein
VQRFIRRLIVNALLDFLHDFLNDSPRLLHGNSVYRTWLFGGVYTPRMRKVEKL